MSKSKLRFKVGQIVLFTTKSGICTSGYKYNHLYRVTDSFWGNKVERITTVSLKDGHSNGWCSEYFTAADNITPLEELIYGI